MQRSDSPMEDENISSNYPSPQKFEIEPIPITEDRVRLSSDTISARQSVNWSSMDAIDDVDVAIQQNILNTTLSQLQRQFAQQIIEIKFKLNNDRIQAVLDCKSHYEEILRQKNETIANLEQQVIDNRQEYQWKEEGLLKQIHDLEILHQQELKMKDVRFAFSEWQSAHEIAKLNRTIDTLATKIADQNLQTKTFLSFLQEQHRAKIKLLKEDLSAHVNDITRETIKRYESEVYILTNEVNSLRIKLKHECIMRQQLEEDLRRMFLKNMTSMNLEAYRIFKGAINTELDPSQIDLEGFEPQPLPMPVPHPDKYSFQEIENKHLNLNNTQQSVNSDFSPCPSPIPPPPPRTLQVADLGRATKLTNSVSTKYSNSSYSIKTTEQTTVRSSSVKRGSPGGGRWK